MPPTLAKFLTGVATIQLFVNLAAQSASAEWSDRPPTKLAHSTLIAFVFLFSHTTCRSIERLFSTQPDEVWTSCWKGKFQSLVEVDGYVHQTFTGEQPS